MQLRRFLLFVFIFWTSLVSGQSVFFNEVDYLLPDYCGEIVSPPGSDLTDWYVTLYDDAGIAIDTISLTGVPPSEVTPTGFNIIEVDIVFMTPTTGGLVLVDNTNQIVQFISYATELTAVDGPAAGLTAENIGTQTASGNSHQLEGVGSQYEDFTWNVPGDGSCGMENDNQELIEDLPLPVELLFFSGTQKENGIELSWATISEFENDHFIIEKRTGNSNPTTLANIPGAGNSNSTLHYNFTDEMPVIGDNYYRLIQVDRDGSQQMTSWIIVHFESDSKGILLYPNPVADQLHIYTPELDGSARLSIYNMLGQTIWMIENVDNWSSTIFFNTNEMSSGQYLIVLEHEGKIYRQRFIKQ